MTVRDTFLARFDFTLDEFQREAMDSLDRGHSVLVAAPTGAGKTIAGEYAVHKAVADGVKVFYTAPIKALSNQKYNELCEWLGHDRVGLVTGDISINSEAEVVVMTTEILRNMMYAQSPTLTNLGYVVMDEVHYLADRLRGPVWEEIIIHLSASVQLVALSATVSNVEEFGAWLAEVRGDTDVVVSERRPIPLWQHVLNDHDLIDVFLDEDGDPTPSHGPFSRRRYREVNPALDSLGSHHALVGSASRRRGERSGRRGYRDRRNRHGDRHAQVMRPRPMSRADVIEKLESEGMLPAIFFIFSRAGCELAVGQLMRARVRLTDNGERSQIAQAFEAAFGHMRPDDVEALGLEQIKKAAMEGIAAHHAGQLPAVKVVIEDLFARGLIKVVFATETLALGINMPARTVVLDKLTKFNGTDHAPITPGEYTQLTGRAGRRGIDVQGHAVVVVPSREAARDVAGLASTRTYPLRSAFRPTYNMAVNLLGHMNIDDARSTLERSFAQFQTDRSVVSQARKARELEETAEMYAEALTCEHGDIREYADILERIGEREKALSRAKSERDRKKTLSTVSKLRRGDIIAIPGGRRQGFAVVAAHDKTVSGPVVHVVTSEGQLKRLGIPDFPARPMVLATMRVPGLDRLKQGRARRDTAAALREHLKGEGSPRDAVRQRTEPSAPVAADAELDSLKSALREHPCHACPERDAHMRWISRYRKAARDRDRAVRSVAERTSALGRQFDRVTSVLEALGYLECNEERSEARVTDKGMLLTRIFSERDLIVCEAIDSGLLSDLGPAALAAVASCLCFEPRRSEGASLDIDDSRVSRTLHGLTVLSDAIRLQERRAGLDEMPEPHAGLASAVYRWARGMNFAQALDNADVAPGDFVRHVRQVIDLLDHVGHLRRDGVADLAANAMKAKAQLLRGIVAEDM